MRDKNIVDMVRRQAGKYGIREVFRYKDKLSLDYKSLSWNELDNQIDKVASSLLSMGYGFDSKVGIFSDNRPEWTIADLSILAIRGVVVPFFSTCSKQQVKYIVDETGMKLMFIGNQLQLEKAQWLLDNCKTLEKIIVFEAGICPKDERLIEWKKFSNFNKVEEFKVHLDKISEEANYDDLATIIYTSGTTGEPKGVMLGNDNFIECFHYHNQRLDVTEKDVSLCFLPLSHVFERTWTFYLLHCGAVNTYLENPRNVIQELPFAKPNVMCTVPRFFEKTYEGVLVETSKWPGFKKGIFDWAIATGHKYLRFKCKAKKAPVILRIKNSIANLLVLKKFRNIFGGHIRCMPCAGAAIRPELLKFFHAAGIFVNYGYGATETTATLSCCKTDIYNLDTCGSIMPGISAKISSEGEILVKGKTIFKGYYKKDIETQEVMVDGWYKTGDQGYIIDNEYIVMTDRIKDIFKTSVGKFVSPQKIELLLGQDNFIEQIITIGDNRKYISALIVPSFANLRANADKLGLTEGYSNEQFANDPKVYAFLKERIEQLQDELTSFEKVIKFTLISEPFSIENNALTSSLKIRRKVIIEKYNDLIDKMY